MAGNYPDAPSWRMAYDRDGSIGFGLTITGVLSQLTEVELQAMNDESGTTATLIVPDSTAPNYMGVLFPELRDVDGFFVVASSNSGTPPGGAGPVAVQVSEDTTNGLDGSWSTVKASYTPPASFVAGDYRTAIQSVTALAVRGIRVQFLSTTFSRRHLTVFHVYGERSPGQALNALELWHPTADEKLPPAWLDWGNTPRGSSEDRTFRVKNVSTVSTAEDVRVAFDVLTDGAPSVPGQHLLSYGGGSFLAQINVGDLAPGAISGAVTLRRVTASNAQLGLFAFRVFAEPDAWS